ncbi:trypsin, alkaline C-like [Convolutriloba macropyga]|uniref:trypsin, alkaline C-like n=1 Tax=Convolutriloba macropyga TaxID=536237 RepID=UPI003F521A9E
MSLIFASGWRLLLPLFWLIIDAAQNKPSWRITGGERVNSAQKYPFFVQVIESAGPNAFFRCAGTIITERTIVTAAHCLTNEKGTLWKNPNNFIVVSGTVQFNFLRDDRHKLYHFVSHYYYLSAYREAADGYDIAGIFFSNKSWF